MKCLLNKIIQRDRSGELQGAPFQLFFKDGNVLCILSTRSVGLGGSGPELRSGRSLQKRPEGSEHASRSRASSMTLNLALLDPGLFAVVCKSLRFCTLFQGIWFFTYPWLDLRNCPLEPEQKCSGQNLGKKKMIAQAAGFLIEACQIPKADAFSFCSSWIRGLHFGFKDKGNTSPIR